MTSSVGSSKRACGEVNNAIQAVTCLVDECVADLTDCRKYYQRHKVCEVHSKSSQVSIDGQKLRFCQQCSRFHTLDEFDEGKRSCRKRLDGHNRRRRKPRLSPPNHGSDMLNSASQLVQVHPTRALTNPIWSEFVETPAWVDHSNHAPSLLSSSVVPTQASISTLSHVVHPQCDSGSVSIKTSPLDQGLSYVSLENDCDVGWGGNGMPDMDLYHHESFDHEDPHTLPYYWQS